MDWINNLLWGQGIGHTILLIAVTIALGLQLGKIKVLGISLGVTFILFVGLLFGQLGFQANPDIIHFFEDFGLILFVYSIGMQVGPGFFSNFKQGGLTLNMLAIAIVLMGAGITILLHFTTGTSISTMVGIMSGAITNTPGLGAAQQAFSDVNGVQDPSIALGYAVTYPLGVIGIIMSMIIIRYAFHIKLEKENKEIENNTKANENCATPVSLLVKNPAVFGKKISEISELLESQEFVISRIWRNDNKQMEIANPNTVLNEDDKIFVICRMDDKETISTMIGKIIAMERKQWILATSNFISRKILVTNPKLNGKRLSELNLNRLYGVNVTRIYRGGIDLVATDWLQLQVGDRMTVVGTEISISNVEKTVGNSIKGLDQPNLVSIFIGIALGIILGSIPIWIPGIPQPLKLGLAGGPLIISIIISRFGYHYKLITFTTPGANFMLRELGIAIFLACVGIGAGSGFWSTIMNGGLVWVGYGLIITIIPLLVVGMIGRYFFKINYFTLSGMIAGCTTDPPALAYANATAGNDAPAVGYAAVYPISMFLRIVVAQLMILFFI